MKPEFKVGDNCNTEEFGIIVVRDIYESINYEGQFIYCVSPINDLENEWFLQQSSLSK